MKATGIAFLLVSLVAPTVATVPVTAQEEGPPPPLDRTTDAWSAHALSDEDAARQGRAALPFTPR